MSIYPDANRSLVWQLREAAKNCYKEELRIALKESADRIAAWTSVLQTNHSMSALKHLNGEVSRSMRLWEQARMPPDPAPQSGAMTETRLAA